MSKRPLSSCQHGFTITNEAELQPYNSAMRALSEALTPQILKYYLLPRVLADVRTIVIVSGVIVIVFRSPKVTAAVCVMATVWWLGSRRWQSSLSSTLSDDQIQYFIEHVLYDKHESMIHNEDFVKLLLSQATDSMLEAYRCNKWNNLVVVDLYTKLAVFLQLSIYFVNGSAAVNNHSNTNIHRKYHKMRSTREFRLRYFKAVAKLCGSREAILFLDSNTSCACLARLQVTAKTTASTCAASGCHQILGGSQSTFECMGCRSVRYCSRRCYKLDWACRHRHLCMALNGTDRHCTCRGYVIMCRDVHFVLRNALKRCDACGLYQNLIYDAVDMNMASSSTPTNGIKQA